MENASKALIIAGAILLSIAIIGVGMFVFKSVSDTITDSSDLTAEQANAYNQEFTNYNGKQRGTQVKQLCDKVSSHNRNALDASELIAITNEDLSENTDFPAPTAEDAEGTTTAEINQFKAGILSGKTYNVTFAYDPESGLVTKVGISEITSGN